MTLAKSAAQLSICGTASKSVAQHPNLWHGSQCCGLAAKSAARQPQTYERWPITWLGALQPDMRQNGQICGTVAQSVEHQPYL